LKQTARRHVLLRELCQFRGIEIFAALITLHLVVDIAYTIRSSARARHARITVRRSGEVVAVRPSAMPLARFNAWVNSKKQWIERAVLRIQKHKPQVSLPNGRRSYLAHRERARALVHEKIKALNAVYGHTHRAVRIKQHSSRWGSCSTKGNLNFNYQIIFLPDHIAAYIVAHELCHLKEMNHSRAFWKLVARTAPDYKVCRKALKRYEMA